MLYLAFSAQGCNAQEDRAENSRTVMKGTVSISTGGTTNRNWLVHEYRSEIVLKTSTAYAGWPLDKLIDNNPETSWFSASRDSAAHGSNPWIEISIPRGETISRVTICGNREPYWRRGYSVKLGKIELFDTNNNLLASRTEEAMNEEGDIDYLFKNAVKNVSRIKFTSTRDEGSLNPYGDIAIGEIEVE